MALTLLHLEFPFNGPWGDALAQACATLAADIAAEPELRWKLWTEDREGGRAGGEYLFESRAAAERYLAKHRARLQAGGVTGIEARFFEINVALSRLTHAALPE